MMGSRQETQGALFYEFSIDAVRASQADLGAEPSPIAGTERRTR